MVNYSMSKSYTDYVKRLYKKIQTAFFWFENRFLTWKVDFNEILMTVSCYCCITEIFIRLFYLLLDDPF